MFNRVELRGVRRKKDEDDTRFLGSRKEVRLAVERSVVHHNYAPFFQGWKKLVGKPKFKQRTIHCTIILQRHKNLAIQLGSNNPASFVFTATDFVKYFLSSERIAIFSVQVRINPALIHIYNVFHGIGADLRLIRRYFFLILFPISRCLFFRVMFRRFIAR